MYSNIKEINFIFGHNNENDNFESIIDKANIISNNKNDNNNNNIFKNNISFEFISTKLNSNENNYKKEVKFITKKRLKRKKHTKDDLDNTTKKFKSFFFMVLIDFINEKLKEIYKDDKDIKLLLKTKGNIIYKKPITFNKELLNLKLKEIFYEDISSKYSDKKYQKNHNKLLIDSIQNIKNEEKKNKIEKLFEITFIECLWHINNIKNNEILNGLTNHYKTALNKTNIKKKCSLRRSGRFFINYFI